MPRPMRSSASSPAAKVRLLMMANGCSLVPESPFKTIPGGSSPWGRGSLVLTTALGEKRPDFGKNGSFPYPGVAVNVETKGETCPGIVSTFGGVCARVGRHKYARRIAQVRITMVFFML